MNEQFDAKEIYAAAIEPKVNEVMDLLAKYHIPALFMVAEDNINVKIKANIEPEKTPANIQLAMAFGMNAEAAVKAMETIIKTADKIGGNRPDTQDKPNMQNKKD